MLRRFRCVQIFLKPSPPRKQRCQIRLSYIYLKKNQKLLKDLSYDLIPVPRFTQRPGGGHFFFKTQRVGVTDFQQQYLNNPPLRDGNAAKSASRTCTPKGSILWSYYPRFAVHATELNFNFQRFFLQEQTYPSSFSLNKYCCCVCVFLDEALPRPLSQTMSFLQTVLCCTNVRVQTDTWTRTREFFRTIVVKFNHYKHVLQRCVLFYTDVIRPGFTGTADCRSNFLHLRVFIMAFIMVFMRFFSASYKYETSTYGVPF